MLSMAERIMLWNIALFSLTTWSTIGLRGDWYPPSLFSDRLVDGGPDGEFDFVFDVEFVRHIGFLMRTFRCSWG